MRITIVGAGPVGLLTACLLARKHQITIVDKRTQHIRNHPLNISEETIQVICEYLSNSDEIMIHLIDLLRSWSNQPVNTSIIQESLLQIAEQLGVRINLGVNIESLDIIEDSIVIGADGARSKIRQLVFNNKVVDQHTVSYMAQLKFTTPGATRPRPLLTTMGHCFLNGITGDDIVVNFESMPPPNNDLRKSGTLHIPIPRSVYDILTMNGRGNFDAPWTPEELATINDPHVAKLLRIIKRYIFGVTWRQGWVENPKLNVIPLTIYRSERVFTVTDDKLVLLVGDAASGCIFERGLNNGFFQSVKLASILLNINSETIYRNLIEYSEYCVKLYEYERDRALQKGRKIHDINVSTSVGSKIVTLGLGSLLSGFLIKSGTSLISR